MFTKNVLVCHSIRISEYRYVKFEQPCKCTFGGICEGKAVGFFFSWKLCMICLYDFWQIPVNSLQSVSNSGLRFKKCFYFIIENLLSMGFDIMVKDFKEMFITVNYYLDWMCWIHTFFCGQGVFFVRAKLLYALSYCLIVLCNDYFMLCLLLESVLYSAT